MVATAETTRKELGGPAVLYGGACMVGYGYLDMVFEVLSG